MSKVDTTEHRKGACKASWRQLCEATTEPHKELRESSPVGSCIEIAFAVAQFLSVATIYWGTRKYSETINEPERATYAIQRAKWVEYLIIAWTALLLATLVFARALSTLGIAKVICVLGAIRCADILQSNVNAHIFDAIRLKDPPKMTSLVRSTLISAWNYIELVGWFATFYHFFGGIEAPPADVAVPRVTSVASAPVVLVWAAPEPVGTPTSVFDALYFSTITQLTIGFGDLKPHGVHGRALAMIQGLVGTLMLVLSIARFVSELPEFRKK